MLVPEWTRRNDVETKKEKQSAAVFSQHATSATVILTLFLFSGASLWARPVSRQQAEKMVRGWLRYNPEPLGVQVGKNVRETQVHTDPNGEAMYYIVYLQQGGFVVVPADDDVEPIIALVARGTYDPSPNNPLGTLVSGDVPRRIAAVRALEAKQTRRPRKNDLTKGQAALQETILKAQGKWAKLQDYAETVSATGIPVVSDVRVAPLVQTKWAQTGLWLYPGGEPVYVPIFDCYTPGSHYPCGCTATAAAQLMRYHEHPTAGVYVFSKNETHLPLN
jgi:hypothetical protein